MARPPNYLGGLFSLKTQTSVGLPAPGEASRFSCFPRAWQAIPCAAFPFWLEAFVPSVEFSFAGAMLLW